MISSFQYRVASIKKTRSKIGGCIGGDPIASTNRSHSQSSLRKANGIPLISMAMVHGRTWEAGDNWYHFPVHWRDTNLFAYIVLVTQ